MSRTDADRLREAIVEIRKLRAQLAEAQTGAAAPVAVIGAACRIHGGADTPEAFWQILLSGRDCVVETPRERWDLAEWYSPDPGAAGKLNIRHGGYLDRLAFFDPAFFGISDREARAMDPQQRLLLEVSWEALEAAAQPAARLDNTPAGVFFALNNNEYFQMAMERDAAELDAYSVSGGVHSTAAGRLSYWLGLRGPSMSVDTACSSSLSAAHLAVQSLRAGESRMALAGGVHLTLRPHLTVGLCRLRMMAPDGRCKPFDAAADGFVQGEGCVVVVLKLLKDAVGDGDPILAVIRGSAMNQDGRSSGLTAPSGPAQEDVIRAALRQSGLAAPRIDFVETHGTGTALGDPLEARALSSAYCAGQARHAPLYLGALKSAFGHLGPASGLAGLLKLIYCLREGEIPPNLHLRNPSPFVDWEQSKLALPRARTPWPTGAEPRAGAVSSFGFSGTNVHMVLEQYREDRDEPAGASLMLPISAHTPKALNELAARFAEYLEQTADSWPAICYTAGSGRDHAPHRLAVVAGSRDEAARKLRERLAGTRSLPSGVVPGHPAPKLGQFFKDGVLPDLLAEAERWVGAGFEADWVSGSGVGALAAACTSGAIGPQEAAALVDGKPLPEREARLRCRWVHPATGQILHRAAASHWRDITGQPVGFGLVIDGNGGPDAAAFASLYIAGFTPHWGPSTRRVRLPNTPFQRRRFWAFDDIGPQPSWELTAAYLRDHRIAHQAVLPGAWYLARALELAGSGQEIRNVGFHHRVRLDRPVPPTVHARREQEGGWSFHSSVRLVTLETVANSEPAPAASDWWYAFAAAPRVAVREDHLRRAEEQNVQLGPAFQAIEEIRGGGREYFARLTRPGSLNGSEPGASWHPALLDACLQVCGRFTFGTGTWVPAAIDRLNAWVPATDEFCCHASLVDTPDERTLRANLECVDLEGRPLLSIQGVVFRRESPDWFYRISWQPSEPPTVRRRPRRIAFRNAPPGLAEALNDCGGEAEALVFFGTLPVRELRAAIREIVDMPPGRQPELWFVTVRGQMAMPTDLPDPREAARWGLCSTLSPENNGLRVRRVDLDSLDTSAARSLVDLIQSDSTESEWARRNGEWFSPRLRQTEIDAAPWAPRPDALYLITGGTGGIGLAIAEALEAGGARHMVLAARRPPSSAVAERIAAMERRGARVHVVQADLSREDSVLGLVEYCRAAGVPLRGIFHAAGVVRDGLFLQLDEAAWGGVFGPKFDGARHLDKFTQDFPLDCFVMFSSISAYMGAAGQANYAAANAALDALAHARYAAGKPALSVNWGAWSETGMAASMGKSGARRLEQLGLQAMHPREGCDALWRAIASGLPQVTILPPVRWERLLAKLHPNGVPSILRLFAPAAAGTPETQPAAGESSTILERLQCMAAGILGSSNGLPEPDRPLLAAGFDSLMAMEMRAAVLKNLGVNLPVSGFLTGLTLRDLASSCLPENRVDGGREHFEV